MENVPEIPRCFGMFPPKYATFLIGVFAASLGGVGIAGIVLFGLVEDSAVAKFIKKEKTDETVKKATLLTIGLSSLLLATAGAVILAGVFSKSYGALALGGFVLFSMAILVLLGCIAAPVSCFFKPETCLVKKISPALLVVSYILITIFASVWSYFTAVIFNRVNELDQG